MRISQIYKYTRPVLIPFIPLYLIAFYIKKFFAKPEKFNVPVICVGNITTGGTGKTPAVIMLAKLLKDMGFYPGVVSRGYHGSKSKEGAIVSDGSSMLLNARESGDEPFLIAKSLTDVPVAICGNRPAAIRSLISGYNVNLIIMDDGFQNCSVHKDITIVAIDATNPFGNELILPAGDLREPKSSLRRSDIIFINRSELIIQEKLKYLTSSIKRISQDKEIFYTDYHNEYLYQIENTDNRLQLSKMKGKKVLIVAGIANPAALMQTISKYDPACVRLRSFADHHYYTAQEIKKILYESENYDLVITTEKDYVKMPDFQLNGKFYVLRISMLIKEIDLFKKCIESSMRDINS